MTFALSAPARAAGHRLVAFAEIGSTNGEAQRLAREGERGPLWLVTGRQTAGRGRRGHGWETPPGNLAATFLLGVATLPALTASLSFAAALAVRETLVTLAPGLAPKLKWPNDVLVEGAKIAGILLETETARGASTALAIGIGINVASAPTGLPYPAAALSRFAPACDATRTFAALTEFLPAMIALWDEGRGLPALRERWLACAAGIGEEVTVRAGGTLARGTFETLDEDGRMILRLPGGARRRIGAGEVHFDAPAMGA